MKKLIPRALMLILSFSLLELAYADRLSDKKLLALNGKTFKAAFLGSRQDQGLYIEYVFNKIKKGKAVTLELKTPALCSPFFYHPFVVKEQNKLISKFEFLEEQLTPSKEIRKKYKHTPDIVLNYRESPYYVLKPYPENVKKEKDEKNPESDEKEKDADADEEDREENDTLIYLLSNFSSDRSHGESRCLQKIVMDNLDEESWTQAIFKLIENPHKDHNENLGEGEKPIKDEEKLLRLGAASILHHSYKTIFGETVNVEPEVREVMADNNE